MSSYKVTEQVLPEYPTYERIERIKQAGYKTDGQIDNLKEILSKKGLKLPIEIKEGFMFRLIDEKRAYYTFIYLNLVDAIAEKLLKTTTEKLI